GALTLSLCRDGKIVSEKICNVDNAKVMRIKWAVPGVELWTTEKPVLYTLKVKYADDETSVRFGFRTCSFTRKGFYLNGKHIKLRGLNRHQSYPYVGNAMPASAQIADAELLKYKLGCNFVRTSHYPDSVHFLNRCDEIGLLVFTEMPSWQFLGEGEWRQICLENIQDMIIRDRNHPCVVLWGVRVNEGNDCDEFYTETNALAHSLDDSRQTGGVRNFPRSHLLEDVYTYNDFSHSGGPIKLLPPTLVAGIRAPYLVTEYNGHMYPTKSFDREELRREVALRHARVQNKSYSSDRYCGATAWCMADYNTHKDFGSGDRICYHGVTDMFRVPKLSAAVYASQQDTTPVLEVSSAMDVGEHPGAIIGQIYIFTNCDYVKIYKNGVYKSTAHPNKNKFAHLPHPPILPEDYIGDSLEKDEGLNPTSAKFMKKAMVAAAKYGYIMPPHHYLELAAGVVTGAMPIPKVVDLVTKYFANWGDEQVEYRFDGYKDGRVVKSVTKTAVLTKHLTAFADSYELVEDKTYDVTRIELRCEDQNNNLLPFANNAIKVTVDGPAKIIGPDQFALIGGDRAFWIRTVGKSGDITVTIEAEGLNTQIIKLQAVKK
ncbi:MAG: glycoside hydrolase family 2 protein, partial [Clostridia bacterium]|nr:glycoside hydrolase family 2 protein [Clostridia bacterium]